MGFFDNVQVDHNVAVDEDRLGGYQPIASGIYKGKIEMAHGVKAQSGAQGLRVVFNLTVDGKPRALEQTFWITTREGKTFTIGSDGTRRNLGGYNQAQALASLLCNNDLFKLETQDRPVKVRNDTPDMVPVFVGMLNKEVAIAVLEVEENARKKQPNGNYEPVNERRKTNEIDKIFDAQGFTSTERKANAGNPEFATKWKERWAGKTKDNFKEVAGSTSSSNNVGATIAFD